MKWLYILVLCVVAFAQNPEENIGSTDPRLFEGDMILTGAQRLAALMGRDVDNPFGRASIKNRLWPGGVMVYAVHRSLARSRTAMWAINEGMAEWTRKTCIRFKKRTKEAAYAYFVPGGGCSSYVGRTGKRQDITLARGCWTHGIAAHEIGHALGFWHEQSRPDRDKWVTIFWNNIIEKEKHNFNKYSHSIIDSLGTPYDTDSIMHYGPKEFSKNGKPTILPKDKSRKIGQRNGVSRWDANQMNLLYKCKKG